MTQHSIHLTAIREQTLWLLAEEAYKRAIRETEVPFPERWMQSFYDKRVSRLHDSRYRAQVDQHAQRFGLTGGENLASQRTEHANPDPASHRERDRWLRAIRIIQAFVADPEHPLTIAARAGRDVDPPPPNATAAQLADARQRALAHLERLEQVIDDHSLADPGGTLTLAGVPLDFP